MRAHLHLKKEKAKSNWFTTERRKDYGWSKISGTNADMRLSKRGKKKNVTMGFSSIKKEAMPSASREKETFSTRDLRKNSGNWK